MTKDAKSDSQWTADMLAFADSRKKNRGRGACTSSQVWTKQYENIRKCPQHSSTGMNQPGIQQYLTTQIIAKGGCTCGWHDRTNPFLRLIGKWQAPAPTPVYPPAPPVEVPFLLPEKPQPRRSIPDVRNKTKTYVGKTKVVDGIEYKIEFDLTVFGHTEGRCPHCNGKPSNRHDLNLSPKIIHTLDLPRYVQGIGMKCSECRGTWQTYEKGYVDTLPKFRKKELNAVIVGGSDGIDMGLVTMMRSGATARSVHQTCVANLSRWHSEMKDDYETRVKKLRGQRVNIVQRAFKSIEITWAATQEKLTRAFLRDYLSVRDSLNCEMASIKIYI